MLAFEEHQRPPAKEALRHIWIEGRGADEPPKISLRALSNLKIFGHQKPLQKLARLAMAMQMHDNDVRSMRETFLAFDKNGDGCVSFNEMRSICEHPSVNIALPGNFQMLFNEVDTDKSGKIDYTEFLAASMDTGAQTREDLIWAAFRVLDTDSDGKITLQELRAILHGDAASIDGWAGALHHQAGGEDPTAGTGMGAGARGGAKGSAGKTPGVMFVDAKDRDAHGGARRVGIGSGWTDRRIAEMIADFDKNGDGVIDFEEFVAMMREGAGI